MRRVAGEQHAAMAESLHALAGKGVDAGPDDLELHRCGTDAVEQRAHPRNDALGLALYLRIRVPAELEVDAPDAVGLLVQERALARMERRVEPEAAFAREVGGHRHVRDQEAVVKDAALRLQPHQRAHRRARSVAGGEPAGLQPIGAAGRVDGQRGRIGRRLDADDGIAPADLDVRQRERALGEEAFDVVLLQVDERRPLVPVLGQQVEAVDQRVLEVDAAEIPRHALANHRVAAAEPVEYFQRALGEADRARAGRQLVVVVEQQHLDAALREVDCETQADGPRSDDDDRVQRRLARALVRRRLVFELDGLIVLHIAHDSSDSHIALSRSAVQMRGSRYCVASSSARVTSNGMQWSKMTHWPYFGFSAACVSW